MDKWQVHRHIQDEAIKCSDKFLGSFILYLFNKNRSYIVSFIFDISSSALSSVTNYLLFYKSKGHGSGCTTALRGMHSFLYRVYVCIVEHKPPPCAVTIHKTVTDQQCNGFQDNDRIQDHRSMLATHQKL